MGQLLYSNSLNGDNLQVGFELSEADTNTHFWVIWCGGTLTGWNRMRSAHSIISLILTALLVSNSIAQQIDSARLVKVLTGTSEKAKLRELAKLEGRAKERNAVLSELCEAVLKVLEKAPKKDDYWLPASTRRLIDLIGSTPAAEATDTLIKLLRSDHKIISMASAETLGSYNRKTALLALIEQTEREVYEKSFAYRFSILKSIAQIRTTEAVLFLSSTIPKLDGQLRHEVATFLGQVDKNYFGGSEEAFFEWKTKTWAPLLGESATGALPGTAQSYREAQYKRATYYGMPIYAKRLIFIIDRSPSMDEMVGGQSRLRRAVIELSQAIEALDPETEFTVIVFDGRVKTWRKELMEATDANKQKALRFVRQFYRTNLTNTYAALRTALKIDDNIEAIYMISDGEPTTGSMTEPAAIVEDITRRNSFRYTAINTVGIGLTGIAQSFMQELAEQNGGEYRDTE